VADDPKKKARRKALGFWDAQDRVLKLNTLYRLAPFGTANTSAAAKLVHDQLDTVSTPEPDEELVDSDLSDVERRAAITRERMRREGLI
jgi:hypothetical protein